MKKNLFVIFALAVCFNFSLVNLCLSQTTEELIITTYYPAPYGVYKQLQLYPTDDINPNVSCARGGELYYDNSDNQLYICDGATLKWQAIGGLWTLSGNNLYPNDLGWQIGIGTDTPQEKLYVYDTGDTKAVIESQSSHSALRIKNDMRSWILGVEDSSGRFRIFQEGGGGGERLTFLPSGNIGIGTTSPDKPLTIQGVGANSELLSFKDNSANTKWHINLKGGGLNFAETGFADYRLFLREGGNIGIGTTSPAYKLDVAGVLNLNKGIIPGVALRVNGDEALWYDGNYFSWGYGGNFNYFAGPVGIGTTSPTSSLEVNGNVTIQNGNVGIGTAPVALYRLAANGVVGIFGEGTGTGVAGEGGTKGVFGSTLDSGKIGVFGYAPAAGIGVQGVGGSYDFYANGPGTDYGTSSSIRWKKNIRKIDNALEKVLNIRGVYFDWDEEHGGEHDIGFIAEEVGEQIPEIVEYEEDGIYTTGIDYGAITPVLVEAIKELKAEIEALKQRRIN